MHNPAVPGERLDVLEATTGRLMWSFPIQCEGSSDSLSYAIADGMLFADDTYTCQEFAFGKGPTQVEVSVPKAQIAKGEYAWITGTVTDASPAQAGTPCVSTADMGPWMEYLHAGMPDPGYGKTGVSVTLFAQKTDGTQITIGTVTTDGDTGFFSYRWTPPDEDLYTITAIFDKDESYWGSWGSTILAVGQVGQVQASTISSSTTATLAIAIIAAVVIGATVIKKQPFKNRMEETQK